MIFFQLKTNRSEFWNFLLFYYIIIILCFSPYFFPIIEHKLEILAINNYKPLDTYTDQFYFIGLIVSLFFIALIWQLKPEDYMILINQGIG